MRGAALRRVSILTRSAWVVSILGAAGLTVTLIPEAPTASSATHAGTSGSSQTAPSGSTRSDRHRTPPSLRQQQAPPVYGPQQQPVQQQPVQQQPVQQQPVQQQPVQQSIYVPPVASSGGS
jgi:hypothetical protein